MQLASSHITSFIFMGEAGCSMATGATTNHVCPSFLSPPSKVQGFKSALCLYSNRNPMDHPTQPTRQK